MPRISAERKQDRLQSILDAAGRVFAAKGLQAASMADVAHDAGVSDGLLYRYFENKRALVDQVLQEFYERLLARLEKEVARHSRIEDQLGTLIQLHLKAFVEEPGLCRLFISEVRVASNYPGSNIQALNRRYTTVLLRIVDGAAKKRQIKAGLDATLFRDLLFGGIEHLAWRHVNAGRRLNIESDANVIAGILLDGVKNRSRTLG
jgi:AcrR family transcriptional regulator